MALIIKSVTGDVTDAVLVHDAEKDDLPIELPVLEQVPERARAGHDRNSLTSGTCCTRTLFGSDCMGLVRSWFGPP